ncbi:NACHT, LRR and PYD domains-containing protein 1 homolog [Sardina pilchardus]|uniref:NACHT, LRR and PYD domains-containing protein 1 homolog n=1 Tax=Sardina pilchardus TaxID=27697 RepID=UPI002E11AD38
MQSRPAGPLMDIRPMSGELEEIHLPHFLCLGGCEVSVRDAVRVLHGRDSGVCVEECELTRHHARLLHPSFSPRGIISYLKSWLFPTVHSLVLVYEGRLPPLSYRAYLLPEDPRLKQLVKNDEEELGGVRRENPHPVRPLQMEGFYSLRTDCKSELYPEELMLRYSKTTPNFYKAELLEAAASFHMELFSSADSRGQCVWRGKFQSGDESPARPPAEIPARARDAQSAVRIPQGAESSRDTSRETSGAEGETSSASAPSRHPDPGQDFFSKHKGALETRLPVLASILIPLQQRGVLNDLEREQVESKPTSTERNRVLLTIIQNKGATAQMEFYEVLKEADLNLVNDLERTTRILP